MTVELVDMNNETDPIKIQVAELTELVQAVLYSYTDDPHIIINALCNTMTFLISEGCENDLEMSNRLLDATYKSLQTAIKMNIELNTGAK